MLCAAGIVVLAGGALEGSLHLEHCETQLENEKQIA